MSQIRIECPSCSTKGKLDAGALPEAGANIRCPACDNVFFVDPKASAVHAPDATASPETAGADGPGRQHASADSSASQSGLGTQPSTDDTAADPAAARRRASVPRLSVDDIAGADTDPSAAPHASPTPAPEPAPPSPSTAPGHPAASTSPVSPAPQELDDPPEVDVELVDGPPSASGYGSTGGSRRVVLNAGTASISQPVPVADPLRPANHRGAWRVNAGSGMIYDFPDTDNLRAWLETRTSHTGITASTDNGATFRPLAEFPELAGVRARGFRTTTLRMPVQLDHRAQDSAGEYITPGSRDYMSGVVGAVPEPSVSGSQVVATPDEPEPAPTRKKRRAPKEKKRIGARLRPEIDDPQMPPMARALGLLLLLGFALFGAFRYFTYDTSPRIPDTPAGNQFLWVLSAMNGGAAGMNELEVQRHFAPEVLETLPANRLIAELRFWHERNPGYTFDGVTGNMTDYFLEARISTPLQDAGIVTVMVEPTPPHRLIEFRIRPAD